MIDQKTLEEIVRTVVERILREHPELVSRSHDDDAVVVHSGRVLTEADLLVCRRRGKHAIRIRKGTIITPMARDRAPALGVDILVSA